MSAKADPEKIALARQLEADGMQRGEVSRAVGLSIPTLIKWLGKKPRAVTTFENCVCGNHAFATVEPGYVTLLDRGDALRYVGVKLFLSQSGGDPRWLVHRYVMRSDWPNHHVRIHREIMGAMSDELVDHESRDALDNRRQNLRKATPSGNGGNSQQKKRSGSSRFKGVWFERRRAKWVAMIQVNGHKEWLGYFATERAAARAYDAAAIAAFGDFARTNKMLGLL